MTRFSPFYQFAIIGGFILAIIALFFVALPADAFTMTPDEITFPFNMGCMASYNSYNYEYTEAGNLKFTSEITYTHDCPPTYFPRIRTSDLDPSVEEATEREAFSPEPYPALQSDALTDDYTITAEFDYANEKIYIDVSPAMSGYPKEVVATGLTATDYAFVSLSVPPLDSFYSTPRQVFLEPPPTTQAVIGISPASGTEITDPATILTIDWEAIDTEFYDGIYIAFVDDKIKSNSKSFDITDLMGGTGEVEIALSDFEIATNGHWDLVAYAYGHTSGTGIFGRFNTFSGDLVSPPYYLIFNVSGLATPYTFTDPTDWYSTHSERYETPTTFFTSFVGLIAPIFEKVGEFGTQINLMFDTGEAYERGFALGSVFPTIDGYLTKIDMFFGGFPLTSFFKYSILILMAIFIIRMIFKFIPFFG